MVTIKNAAEIEAMRRSCALARETLEEAGKLVRPGISTQDIDDFVHAYIVERGAYPSPLNYRGFPKSVCTSPNEVVCHGIPSPEVILRDGDILNIDVTAYLDGFHGDTNRTFFVGEVSERARKLVEVTHRCMMLGIATVRPGAHLGDIGRAIQQKARAHGYSVVRDFCGHGIGREFHEEPQVLHYKAQRGIQLRPGMTFTIEPMINEGKAGTRVLDDGWTAVTVDGRLSAQFEHTVLVTADGVEILTAWEDGSRPIGL